ncbi:MAG: hypothetical protein A3G25_12690 [Betaproteobacteria bacterium RIFCSPLOWO2_12_FULL_63_13]|nr:MAG: hypothetical protein A3H32_02855 [Betaproteobacteria bacterium RIFCSPLOWO2_02_FULL_63_19]OGA46903.1 MAG: hypothetical protein A3G25_12690 [Betaproteobacteria bacterium RIFCSPLOWO2_12_FULL_63_13]
MPNSSSDVALDAALQAAAPLVEFLLNEGVNYARFASALKTVFLDRAENVLAAHDAKVNDSSISTLSGVHRKDVRAWRAAGRAPLRSKSLGPAMQVFTRWASDPAYCDSRGKPRVLPRTGTGGSFEELAKIVSKDVHPRALLQELIRLDVVRPDKTEGGVEQLALRADAFVPTAGRAEMLQLFSDNVGDHIATAVHNLAGGDPMLEQAVYAEGLRPASVESLRTLARDIWLKAFRTFAREATKLYRRDKGRQDADQRVRFGMYCYRGPATKD